MPRIIPFACALCAMFLSVGVLPPAAGQEQTDVISLQTELQNLRHRLEQIENATWLEQPSCGTCGELDGCHCVQDCGGHTITAGFEFVFAKPQMKESFEGTTTNFATGTMAMVPFQFDHSLSPRAWLHVSADDSVGFRATYWQYDDSSTPRSETATLTTFPGASAVTVIFPAAISTMVPGDVLNSSMSLDVNTLDLEGTIPMQFGSVEVLGSGGLRYAEMDQAFRGTVVSGGSVTQSLAWSRGFDGLGLTVGGDIRAPLGQSNLSLVSNLRGSLLYGDKTISRTVVGDVTPPPNTTPPVIALQDADEVSGVFEISLGLEWSQDVGRGVELFTRGMYEGQLWTAAGAPTLTFLGFEGFSVAVGIAR